MMHSNEVFLIDSNALITPYKLYYPFDFAERFWDQVLDRIIQQDIILLDLVRDELLKGGDELSEWVAKIENALILDRRKSTILTTYGKVLSYLQTSGLYQEKALAAWSQAQVADPWLISTAHTFGYTVITLEKSNGGLNSSHKVGVAKIPDICNAFDVPCKDLFYMMRALSFKM